MYYWYMYLVGAQVVADEVVELQLTQEADTYVYRIEGVCVCARESEYIGRGCVIECNRKRECVYVYIERGSNMKERKAGENSNTATYIYVLYTMYIIL
jgi:hypothetical protein